MQPPFEPYIPADRTLREMSPRALIVGVLLGMVFGASSLYLVLKVGLTVSASIPVAVISITLFRLLSSTGMFRNATILENNITQTAGSAGESIAFGVGVTMPAIMILGFDLEIVRVTTVAVLGGLLGILMMIPLRRALIVTQHGILKYPEGTACAVVLKAGASRESREAASDTARAEERRALEAGAAAGTSAATIFTGFGLALVYKTAMAAFKLWKEVPEKIFGAPLKAASVAAEISPELLGVGYIIGPQIASVMCAGGVLAYLVLIPLIKFFGDGIPTALTPGEIPISQMGPHDIRSAYILYIGAGAVAAGGIISLFRSLPTIWHGLRSGLQDLAGGPGHADSVPRTDRDLPMRLVVFGTAALVAALMLVPSLHMNLAGALMVIVFGFLFVTVSSRLTGEIGSSSNPISGMTVATLLLTSLIFLLLGWTGPHYYVTALSVGAVVCIAAANGGTTSQDLKTGFLVGATPRLQQVAILLGASASALILGPILLELNAGATTYVPQTTWQPVEEVRMVEATGLPEFRGGPDGGPYRVLQEEGRRYLVAADGRVTHLVQSNFPADLRVDPATLTKSEKLDGPQGLEDQAAYRVWIREDTKFLVDDTGRAVYLVDPGINGTHPFRPDGSRVQKFDAPKATLMSYIIKGILNRELPWGLVLLGVMIAVVLEMSGIPSLAFAVGVYLPISSSTPILVGGALRWLVDRGMRSRHAHLTEEERAAEADKSPGVLMASGYIAGGAIAGIVIAVMAAQFADFSAGMEEWSRASNPLYGSDLLSLVPFAVLALLLYLVGRERLLRPSRP